MEMVFASAVFTFHFNQGKPYWKWWKHLLLLIHYQEESEDAFPLAGDERRPTWKETQLSKQVC